ncbi:MAG: hypothetical protein E5V75_23980 [Mesorhizobium sp.]|nr:MAG: hypothetical protein E5V75_23980 [Mesorhizobium sp.]
MKRDGIDFGDPTDAVKAYIHRLEGTIGDLEDKIWRLDAELHHRMMHIPFLACAAGLALMYVGYFGLHLQPSTVGIVAGAIWFGMAIWRLRALQRESDRKFDATMRGDD